MGFDPCNRALKIWESIWESNSKHWSSLGSVRVHSLTLFALLVLSLLARNLATPCLGCEPMARVATIIVSHENNSLYYFPLYVSIFLLAHERPIDLKMFNPPFIVILHHERH